MDNQYSISFLRINFVKYYCADILGNKLTAAIKGGYANADQLEVAINKIGREFTEGKSDVSEFNVY